MHHDVTLKTSDGQSYTYRHLDFLDTFGKNHFDQCKMDGYWYTMATWEFSTPGADIPKFAVVDCYKKLKPHELCLEWDEIYMRYSSPGTITYLRRAISDALVSKKQDPMQCRNPSHDAQVNAEREIEKAKSRARAAEIQAENARAAAAAAKRREECVESGAKYC